jgi:hypothetical protein
MLDCEVIFGAQQEKKRMRDKAAQSGHSLCRSRAVQELQRRRGTSIAEHSKLVLSFIDWQANFHSDIDDLLALIDKTAAPGRADDDDKEE